jgi:RNA polymerase sigma factor (sigma-70 family)
MIRGDSVSMLRALRTLYGVGTAAGLTDGQLLRRFADRRVEATEAVGAAEAAFAALVDRHGPMVWGVCRRALGNTHDAEDAFQATFLILARRAGAVREETLGRWLHGVARRVAVRARQEAERRRFVPARTLPQPPGDPAREVELADLRIVVQEELGLLPERYRAAIELCHLHGLTHEEAARRLGWSARTIKSRLAAGRDRLRGRLARRGLAPRATALTAALSGEVSAAVPDRLVRSTVRAATLSTTGGIGTFPASVAALATGAMKAMLLSKMKHVAVVAILALATTGAIARAFQGPGPSEAGAAPHRATPDPPRPANADDLSKIIEDLVKQVRLHQVHGRKAEALDSVRRLADTVQDWETAIRSGNAPAEGDQPAQTASQQILSGMFRCAECHGASMPHHDPRLGSSAPSSASGGPRRSTSPATKRDSEQDLRIRMLEGLLDELRSTRGQRPREPELPARPATP